MRGFWCRLTRGHEWWWMRDIHGDEINAVNARSLWACVRCGSLQWRKQLGWKYDGLISEKE